MTKGDAFLVGLVVGFGLCMALFVIVGRLA